MGGGGRIGARGRRGEDSVGVGCAVAESLLA